MAVGMDGLQDLQIPANLFLGQFKLHAGLLGGREAQSRDQTFDSLQHVLQQVSICMGFLTSHVDHVVFDNECIYQTSSLTFFPGT